jgi:hypothetical protein
MSILEERLHFLEKAGAKIERDRCRSFPLLDGKLPVLELWWNDPRYYVVECQINKFQRRYITCARIGTPEDRVHGIKRLEAACEKVLSESEEVD